MWEVSIYLNLMLQYASNANIAVLNRSRVLIRFRDSSTTRLFPQAILFMGIILWQNWNKILHCHHIFIHGSVWCIGSHVQQQFRMHLWSNESFDQYNSEHQTADNLSLNGNEANETMVHVCYRTISLCKIRSILKMRESFYKGFAWIMIEDTR